MRITGKLELGRLRKKETVLNTYFVSVERRLETFRTVAAPNATVNRIQQCTGVGEKTSTPYTVLCIAREKKKIEILPKANDLQPYNAEVYKCIQVLLL